MFLAKDLVTTIQAKDEQLINNVDWLLENKFLKIKKKKKKKSRWYCQKIILNFNKQRKGKRCPVDIAKQIKILSPKQMLQRLAIAQAQIKAGNTSENLLNVIRQIICFFVLSKRNY